MMWKRRGKSDRDGWSLSGRVVRSLPCQRRCLSVWKNAWLAKEEKMMHAAISGHPSAGKKRKPGSDSYVRTAMAKQVPSPSFLNCFQRNIKEYCDHFCMLTSYRSM